MLQCLLEIKQFDKITYPVSGKVRTSVRGETQILNRDVGSPELEAGYPDKPLSSMGGETGAHVERTVPAPARSNMSPLAILEGFK